MTGAAALSGLAELAAISKPLASTAAMKLGVLIARTSSTNYYDNSYTTKFVEVLLENANWFSLDWSHSSGLK